MFIVKTKVHISVTVRELLARWRQTLLLRQLCMFTSHSKGKHSSKTVWLNKIDQCFCAVYLICSIHNQDSENLMSTVACANNIAMSLQYLSVFTLLYWLYHLLARKKNRGLSDSTNTSCCSDFPWKDYVQSTDCLHSLPSPGQHSENLSNVKSKTKNENHSAVNQ